MGQRRLSMGAMGPFLGGLRRVSIVALLGGALLPALLTLLLAPWVGMVWEWLAPAPAYVNIEGQVFPVDEDSSEFIAADVWFLVVGLTVGLVSGAFAYWRYRRALPAMVAITAASLIGAWIARETGSEFGPPELAQAAVGTVDGERIAGAIEVRSGIVLLGWPVGVLIAYVSMILGLERPTPKVAGLEDSEEDDCEELEPPSIEAGGSTGQGSSGNGRKPGKDGAFARQQR